jgi:hypothetical protein
VPVKFSTSTSAVILVLTVNVIPVKVPRLGLNCDSCTVELNGTVVGPTSVEVYDTEAAWAVLIAQATNKAESNNLLILDFLSICCETRFKR